MPIWLISFGIGAVSTLFSTQLDDMLDKPVYPAGVHPSGNNAVTYGLYAAGALGLFWLANKSGFLKALK